MTISPSRPLSSASIVWTSVEPGLWVGKAGGEFAGMIEAHPDGGFIATSRHAQRLGKFVTVDAAKASLTRS